MMLSSKRAFTAPAASRQPAGSRVACHAHLDRRQLLLALVPLTAAALQASPAAAKLELQNKEVDDATSPFIQELLRKTAEKKEERKKERLDAYYKKNYKEYFQFDAGDAQTARARGLSPEMQRKINDWLEANK